jgi:hypothetical protein
MMVDQIRLRRWSRRRNSRLSLAASMTNSTRSDRPRVDNHGRRSMAGEVSAVNACDGPASRPRWTRLTQTRWEQRPPVRSSAQVQSPESGLPAR